jgi:hypothetical protein
MLGGKSTMTTLEKVKRLEQYLSTETTSVDPLLDLALDKLMQREAKRLGMLAARLTEQLVAFERTYALRSRQFYDRYQRGEMGDEMDFIEWAATVEMAERLQQRLYLLEPVTVT